MRIVRCEESRKAERPLFVFIAAQRRMARQGGRRMIRLFKEHYGFIICAALGGFLIFVIKDYRATRKAERGEMK